MKSSTVCAQAAILNPDKFDQGKFWSVLYDVLSSGQIDKFTASTMRLGSIEAEEGQFYHPTDAVIRCAKNIDTATYNAVCNAAKKALKPGKSDAALNNLNEAKSSTLAISKATGGLPPEIDTQFAKLMSSLDKLGDGKSSSQQDATESLKELSSWLANMKADAVTFVDAQKSTDARKLKR